MFFVLQFVSVSFALEKAQKIWSTGRKYVAFQQFASVTSGQSYHLLFTNESKIVKECTIKTPKQHSLWNCTLQNCLPWKKIKQKNCLLGGQSIWSATEEVIAWIRGGVVIRGGGGPPPPPTEFVRSVNPISTRREQIMPTQIFRLSYGPDPRRCRDWGGRSLIFHDFLMWVKSMIFLKWIQLAMTLVVEYQYWERKISMNFAHKWLGLNSDFRDHFALSKIVLIFLKMLVFLICNYGPSLCLHFKKNWNISSKPGHF